MRKIIILFLIVFCSVFLTNCNNSYYVLVTYQSSGGILDFYHYEWDLKEDLYLPTPYKENYTFIGWYEDADFSGDKQIVLSIDDYKNLDNLTLYAKYEPTTTFIINKKGYDFKGQSVMISIYDDKDDPFSDKYIYQDKVLRQAQLSLVESHYNCKIEYILTTPTEQHELVYAMYNKDSLVGEKFKKNNILIHYGELDDTFYESYKTSFNDLVFYPLNTIEGYEENSYSSLTKSYNQGVGNSNNYGLLSDELPVLNMILYDEQIFKDLNIPSPQKLYHDGKWTVEKFIEYISLLDKENYINVISAEYFTEAIVNYKGEYLVDFLKEEIYFDKEENLNNLNKLKTLEANSTLYYHNHFAAKQKEDEDKTYGFVSCNLLDQLNILKENDNVNYSFVPYPYDELRENKFVSSTFNCYALYNNYNIESNNITYEMLYSLIYDLSYGFSSLKYNKELLYEYCDNDYEQEMIDYFLDNELKFDGIYAINRYKSITNTFGIIPNYFNYYLNNIENYQDRVSTLIDIVNLELKRIIFLKE